jgi:hypothetical protein
MTKKAFDEYYTSYCPKKHSAKQDQLVASIGYPEELSSTPFFISAKRFKKLVNITQSVIKLLNIPAFQEHARAPWHLPWRAINNSDFFGCVDFQLCGDTEKIVEVNFGTPGGVGIWEAMERAFFPPSPENGLNNGFEDALVKTVIDGVTDPRIAIAVSPLQPSVEARPHYRFVQSLFDKRGIEAKMVFANEFQINRDGLPAWEGKAYNRIFNLLIPCVWNANQDIFHKYTKLFQQHPELFFPSPLGAKLCDKRLLTLFSKLDKEAFGLPEKDAEDIFSATAKAFLLSDFNSVDEVIREFGSEKNLVLKPFEQYLAKGVFIRPDRKQVNKVYREARFNHVVQEFFYSDTFPFVNTSGKQTVAQFEVRIGFLRNHVSGFIAYILGSDAIAPIVVV